MTMFASLIIVVPSLALPQAEYYHPDRALFQVQVAQGLFQFHSVGHHYPGPPEQVSNLWLQCFQRHHILSGRQLRVIMYYPPLHLLRSVLDYLPCSKITGTKNYKDQVSAWFHRTYGLDNSCLNSRMNTSTDFRPVFICTGSVASLHITTCCL